MMRHPGSFYRLRKYNIKLQPDKCEFLRKEVSCLRQVIGQTTAIPDEKRIEAVKYYRRPKITREFKGFCGLAG